MANHIKVLAILSMFFALVGCMGNQGIPKDFDYGTLQEDWYVNAFFDMEVKIPEGWQIQNKEAFEELVDKGENLVAGEDEQFKRQIEASEVNTASLLTVFKYPSTDSVQFNPSFSFIAENVWKYPSIQTGKDYLINTKNLLEQSQMPYSFDRDMYQMEVGTQTFDVLEAKLFYLGGEIRQEYICAIINGFALNIIISYMDDAQKRELRDVVDHVRI